MAPHYEPTPIESLQQCADTLKSLAFPISFIPNMQPLAEHLETIAETIETASSQLAER
jgi:hypothetical protein